MEENDIFVQEPAQEGRSEETGRQETMPEKASEQEAFPGEDSFPTSTADLEREKRVFNEMRAENNTGYIQIFTQNLYENMYEGVPIGQAVKTSPPSKGKTFDLEQAEQCAEFVEQYKDGEHLAMAIILSVFDFVLLSDLGGYQESLLQLLPRAAVEDEDKQEISRPQRNPYLSLDSETAVIGGKTLVDWNGRKGVTFGEKREKVLANLWGQFPSLWHSMTSWLLSLYNKNRNLSVSEERRIALALSRIAMLDFPYAEDKIFSSLYASSQNRFFLGLLVYELAQDPKGEQSVKSLLEQWAQSNSTWLWQVSLLVYGLLQDRNIGDRLPKLLQRKITRELPQLMGESIGFCTLVLSLSSQAADLICQAFRDCFENAQGRQAQLQVCEVYLDFLRYGYFQVDRSFVQLPLAACDSPHQQYLLTPLLSKILFSYPLKKNLYLVLKPYLKEISGYTIPKQVIYHLAAYFQNLMSAAPDFQQDILGFLDSTSCTAAQQIRRLLSNT